MTKELRRLSFILLAMFLSLFAATSWIQVVDADNLSEYQGNIRAQLDSYQIQRGSIIVDGSPIASSVPTDDEFQFQRVYTDSAMWSSVTGYFNPAIQSSTRLEQAFNSELAGTGSQAFFSEIDRIVSGQAQHGFNVELSLSSAAQRAAYEALDGLQGAVVAIEPSTGRILAMVSTPGYDANSIAVHDGTTANNAYEDLLTTATNPLYNRAIGGNLNPPGSTFKLVVASAALSSGDWTIDSALPNPAQYTLPDTSTSISNASRTTCGSGDTVTIRDAIRLSCNIPFAELAVELGDDAIRAEAEKFGFNQTFDTPLTTTASTYSTASLSDDVTAQTGYGQRAVTATPLQMAMVAAGIANDGTVMNPYMVDAVIGDDLSVIQQFESSAYGEATDKDTADAVTEAMVASVDSGAAQNARIDGVDVAGKTGTAENGPDDPYSLWFTGFAPADDPQVAVAVVVEDGGGKGQSGSGDEIAAPIAKKVIEAVLGK